MQRSKAELLRSIALAWQPRPPRLPRAHPRWREARPAAGQTSQFAGAVEADHRRKADPAGVAHVGKSSLAIVVSSIIVGPPVPRRSPGGSRASAGCAPAAGPCRGSCSCSGQTTAASVPLMRALSWPVWPRDSSAQRADSYLEGPAVDRRLTMVFVLFHSLLVSLPDRAARARPDKTEVGP